MNTTGPPDLGSARHPACQAHPRRDNDDNKSVGREAWWSVINRSLPSSTADDVDMAADSAPAAAPASTEAKPKPTKPARKPRERKVPAKFVDDEEEEEEAPKAKKSRPKKVEVDADDGDADDGETEEQERQRK